MLPENTPTFDFDSGMVHLPEVRGVQWVMNGEDVDPGRFGPLQEGERVVVEARLSKGYRTSGETTWTFDNPAREAGSRE